LKNLTPDAKDIEISFVAATPKPLVVKLKITAEGETAFSTSATKRKAVHFVVKVKIGGISGLMAPLLGKQPSDTHVWILEGTAPPLSNLRILLPLEVPCGESSW
jgi:hypothetical protein